MRGKERYFLSLRLMVILVFLLFLPREFSSIPLEEREFLNLREDAVSAYQQGDYGHALIILSQLRELSPELYQLNSFPYLEGRIKEKLGDLQGALSAYEEVLVHHSPLEAYACFRAGEIFTRLGEKEKAIALYRSFLERFKENHLLPQVELALSSLLIEKGDVEGAFSLLQPLIKGKGRVKVKALFLLAKGYEALGRVDEAVSSYYRVIKFRGRDDLALSALTRLEVLEGKKRLPPERLFLRAEAFFANREYTRAIPYYLRLLSRYPRKKEGIEASFRLTTIFRRLRKYSKALQFNYFAIKRVRSYRLKARAYFERGVIYQRMGKVSSACSSFKRVFSHYPRSSYAPLALFQLAEIERKKKRYRNVLFYLKKLERSYPNSSLVVRGRLLGARIALSLGWRASALSWLSGIRAKRKDDLAELLFLRGKIYELFGDEDKAVSSYLRLSTELPNEYLSLLARERIAHLLSPEERRRRADSLLSSAVDLPSLSSKRLKLLIGAFFLAPEGSEEKKEAELALSKEIGPLISALALEEDLIKRELRKVESPAPSFSPLEEVRELFFLGIYDEGAETLSTLRGNHSSFYYFLARAYFKGGKVRPSIAYAERTLSLLPNAIPFELLPRELKELLYPVPPFYPLIEKYAEKRGLDPLLVSALIREESRFDPLAKSGASARGLMQLIPETARGEGRRIGYRKVSPRDLYRPEVNIDIGTAYLARLIRDFNGFILPALAAYNAGKEAVKRWLSLSSSLSDPDLFLLEIGYRETRRYVPLVARSYLRYYQVLKPDKLREALVTIRGEGEPVFSANR